MDIFIIVVLIIAAIIFFILEIFIFPGITLSAIAGLTCMAYSIYYAFINLGTTAGYTTWAASGIITLLAIAYFVRWKRIDKLSLKENITSTVDRSGERSVKIGDQGVAITRLALYGRAMIDGKNIEVKSADGFIDEHQEVVVDSISNSEVSVKKIN